jgi:bacillithiol system protein YtxJ
MMMYMAEIIDSPFVEIDSIAALDEFVENANSGAAVLFKHSSTCGISARAYREMSRLDHPVGLVTVQQARPVSDEIEKRWQVGHETPQVLVVRKGQLAWNASHFKVSADAVNTAVSSAAAS